MNGDYAAEVNARYSTFVNAPAAMGMIKVASEPAAMSAIPKTSLLP